MGTRELLGERDHVLVALDGPVAVLPADHGVAGRLRVLVDAGALPRDVARTSDPFVVLAHAQGIGPATERAVHAQWRRIEHEVLAGVPVTSGVREAFAAIAAAGTRISVVASLDVEAVRAFLVFRGLDEHVDRVAGRAGGERVAVADLIASVVHAGALPASSCAFVGSAESDLAAARAAGLDTVRHRAVTPGSWFDALSTRD